MTKEQLYKDKIEFSGSMNIQTVNDLIKYLCYMRDNHNNGNSLINFYDNNKKIQINYVRATRSCGEIFDITLYCKED